jgi:hypothetical protein
VPLTDLSLKARLGAGLVLSTSISRAAALPQRVTVARISGPLECFLHRVIGAIEGSARFRQGNRQRGP